MGSIAHKLYQDLSRREERPTGKTISVFLNGVFVSVLWVFFRADSISHATTILRGIFRRDGVDYINIYTVVYTLLILLCHIIASWKQNGDTVEPALDLGCFKNKLLLCIWIFLIVMLSYVGESAFIYAQF